MKLFFLILPIFLIVNYLQLNCIEKNLLIDLEKHTEPINNIDYIEFSKISKLFEDNYIEKSSNELKFNNGIIRVAPGSFFLFYENNDVIKIAQLASPAVEFGGKTYLPFQSLIDALINKEIISLVTEDEKNDDKIQLKTLKIRNTFSVRNEKTKNHFQEPIRNEIEVSREKNKLNLSRDTLPPDYYYLPDDLIRTELEDVKPK